MKQLFLLLRPADASSATQRLHNDVTGKEVFRVLRKKHGLGFDSFISEKVTPVFGDISLENLEIKDSALRKKIRKEVEIVANFAATRNLDERYDVALDVNTMGAKHVFDFAENCENLEMILHISTAYIHTGETPGVILEKPFDISQTINENSKILDIDEERRLVRDRLNKLKAAQASKKQETAAMKELGAERAILYGWPNTYAITKAMGEMIMLEKVLIITFDPFVIYSGRGKFPCLLGNHESFLDIIPGDMMVNAVIVAMVNHMKSKSNNRSVSGDDENHNYRYIYHLGSSANREKMNIIKVVKYACEYFCENPLMDKHGNVVEIVKPAFFPTMASFRQHINDNYVLPKKEGKVSVAKRLVEFYEHYLLFKKIFDDSATEELRIWMKANGSAEADMFDFDPQHIDWKECMLNIHIPGLMKYVIEGFNSTN
ncbi:alcohol-forming fatty acyl-CoA reductase-like [Papaver somniferum]|uniref:alcohol-forming fatty acyl-CoA reductase-like n=1 Tax=Papaver somniferum TaxID=3469 RepID=UPI000E6FA073|nr:alcohol-forming fatty acyl-CoA reductase-like [Papaver somniferum]